MEVDLLSEQLSQLREVTESLSRRLAALEQGAAQVEIPQVSEAEAEARKAEAEAAVKIARVQAEAQVEVAKIHEEAETEREELKADAVEAAQETVVRVAEETGEVPTVIPDHNPGGQLPTTNSVKRVSMLERLLLGR